MHVTPLAWWLTIGLTSALLIFDVVVIGRRAKEPSRREVTIALAVFVGLAIAFGSVSGSLPGTSTGPRFFAGWLTEYSLSVDKPVHLPDHHGQVRRTEGFQQSALLIGIVLALVMRGIFNRRRGGSDQQLQLDLLPLRVVPHLHRSEAGPGGFQRRRRVRGEPADRLGREPVAGDLAVARHEVVRDPGRQAADHPRCSW